MTDNDEVDNGGTTDEDYRWKWLSTIWSFSFGLGFPLWLMVDLPYLIGPADLGGVAIGLLFLGWGSTVVYIVGPENVKAWQDLSGSE